MEDPLRWKLLFKALILPPAAPLLIALVGLALLDRHRRAGRFLTTLGVVLLVLVSMPAVVRSPSINRSAPARSGLSSSPSARTCGAAGMYSRGLAMFHQRQARSPSVA